MPTKNETGKKAQHNEKMIELRIRLWTNGIAETDGEILPKQAWDWGVVYMQPNASHGIERRKPKHFHTLMELNAVIEKVLVEHGIKLHAGKRSSRYFGAED